MFGLDKLPPSFLFFFHVVFDDDDDDDDHVVAVVVVVAADDPEMTATLGMDSAPGNLKVGTRVRNCSVVLVVLCVFVYIF